MDFLSGRFDSTERRIEYQIKLKQAAISQPKTQTVSFKGEW